MGSEIWELVAKSPQSSTLSNKNFLSPCPPSTTQLFKGTPPRKEKEKYKLNTLGLLQLLYF